MKKETYPFSRFLSFFSTDACCCLIQTQPPSTLNNLNPTPPLISFIHFVVLYIFIFFYSEKEILRYIINILFCWVVFVITIIIIITIVTSLLWSVIMYVIIICNLMGFWEEWGVLYIYIFCDINMVYKTKNSHILYTQFTFSVQFEWISVLNGMK